MTWHLVMSRGASKTKSKKNQKRGKRKASPHRASGPLPVPRELLSAGFELDAAVERERQGRMESIKAELTRMVADGRAAEAIDQMLSSLLELERENERLSWRVLQADRYRFGRSSEKLSREELGQLLLALGGELSKDADPGQTAETATVPAPEEPEQSADAEEEDGEPSAEEISEGEQRGKKKKKRRRVQRMHADERVERNETLRSLSDEERLCDHCGRPKKVFGHVEHQTFRFEPARIVLDVEKREKAGCTHCRQDVSVAERSSEPDVSRRVDASLLAKLVADKTRFALPVERQRKQLESMGLFVPDKTLASYWAYALDLLEPVGVATLGAVFADPVVGIDDSHLKTLDQSSKHGVFRGHLWCFVGTDPERGTERVGFGYTPSWQAEEIVDWLGSIDGHVQGDGYAGYATEWQDEDTGQTLVLVPEERRLGCTMHVRSKFHDALLAKDERAAIPLKYLRELYEIEDDCKAHGLDPSARSQERRRRSLPLLDALDAWVDAIHPKLLPKSPLRRATTYAINQRAFVRRCFEEGRFEIDNGRTERRIRNFAVGRRNYLFTGSVRGGERLALAYTLVDNCTLLGVDAYGYLLDIIRKLEAGWPLRRLSELIPWNWAATRKP